MNRRNFLRTAVAGSAILAGATACVKPDASPRTPTAASRNALAGMQIIDAHAHPDMDYSGSHWTDTSASYAYMQSIGMAASSFSAVGDRTFRNKNLGASNFSNTKKQIDWWLDGIVNEKKVVLVRKSSDIPLASGNTQPPGMIVSIEGGDALEGNIGNIDAFHAMGVRIITLMHFHNNEIGDIMRPYPRVEWTAGPYRGGLSAFGRDVIAKMEYIGIVVDVAHAHPTTFREMLSAARKPLIDSHTNPSPTEDGIAHGRMRTWSEMELVARNGGVVCTWPSANKSIPRLTMLDWAKEILLMKKNLGMDHVGLGTDGGGYYRPMAEYHDERDLGKLAEAMLEVGLSREDLAAYMGGNLRRVLHACIG